MAEGVKSIPEMLAEIADGPKPSVHSSAPRSTAGRTFADLPTDEKREHIWEMRSKGYSPSLIAKSLGIDVSTVHRNIKAYAQSYLDSIQSEPAANLIAEHLVFLTSCEDALLLEFYRTPSDGPEKVEVDPKTGEVKRSKLKGNNPKLAYMQMAMKARELKMKFQMDTGFIPREPEKLYHTIKREVKDDKEKRSDRTPDEVRSSIANLVAKSRKI